MKFKFYILILFILSIQYSVNAQKFSENTELKLINELSKDFDVRRFSENEDQVILYQIRNYIQNYDLNTSLGKTFKFDSVDNIQINPETNEILGIYPKYWGHVSLLNEAFRKSCEKSIQELNIHVPIKINKEKVFKDSLVYILNLSRNCSDKKIEENLKNSKDSNIIETATRLIVLYYEQKTIFSEYDYLSLQKLVYYLNKLVKINEKKNNLINEKYYFNFLADIARNAQNNFLSYEKTLSYLLNLYKLEKKSMNKKSMESCKIQILNTLGFMLKYSESILDENDIDLLWSTYSRLVRNYLFINSNSIVHHKFYTLAMYFENLPRRYTNISTYKALQKCWMLSAISASKKKRYDWQAFYLKKYIESFSIIFSTQSDSEKVNSTTKYLIKINNLLFKDTLNSEFYKLLNYKFLYFNLKKEIPEYPFCSNNDTCKIVFSYGDSIINIASRIKNLPYDKFRIEIYKSVDEILVHLYLMIEKINVINLAANIPYFKERPDTLKILRNMVRKNNYNSTSTEYLYDYISQNKIEDDWKYRALLTGELEASKDELEKIKDDSLSQKNTLLKKTNLLLLSANDSLLAIHNQNNLLTKNLSKSFKNLFIIGSSAITIFLAMFIIIMISRYNKKLAEYKEQKVKEENSNLKNKAAVSLLSSHTLKHTMNKSLFEYIVENNKTIEERSSYYLLQQKFYSKFHEHLLKNEISLLEELDFILIYSSLFEDKKIKVIVNNNVGNIETIKIPSLLTLSLIENSITKGFRRESFDNIIVIDLNKINQKSYEIFITDNGIGKKEYLKHKLELDKNTENVYQSGMGHGIIKERIDAFNTLNKNTSSIEFYTMEIQSINDNKLKFESGFVAKLIFKMI